MKNKKGITLFEVLISMLILGGVFCGLFASLFFGKRVSLENQDKLIAAALARGFMEELNNEVGVNQTRCLYGGTSCPPAFNVMVDNVNYLVDIQRGANIAGSNVTSASITINWDERREK